ncbi:MAG TPA: hypothetical protein VKZ53_07380 [Candidatus Angelobacter sp.]|nr:hypothetical protein [Candidatus Angelobacter sp.]
MANQSGSVYGLTVLSPVLDDPEAEVSHNVAIRKYLSTLPRDESSPFSKVSSTHMARLVVMEDVVFVGHPAHEEHLKSQYLVFESNFDGDLDTYLTRMAQEIPDAVESVWSHCVGYPGLKNVRAFVAYIKRCQLTTTFYFADVNNKTVQQTLRALQIQSGLARFIELNQGKPPSEIQSAFAEFWNSVETASPLAPGAKGVGELPCFAAGRAAGSEGGD